MHTSATDFACLTSIFSTFSESERIECLFLLTAYQLMNETGRNDLLYLAEKLLARSILASGFIS